jgi:hypothetical protein
LNPSRENKYIWACWDIDQTVEFEEFLNQHVNTCYKRYPITWGMILYGKNWPKGIMHIDYLSLMSHNFDEILNQLLNLERLIGLDLPRDSPILIQASNNPLSKKLQCKEQESEYDKPIRYLPYLRLAIFLNNFPRIMTMHPRIKQLNIHASPRCLDPNYLQNDLHISDDDIEKLIKNQEIPKHLFHGMIRMVNIKVNFMDLI